MTNTVWVITISDIIGAVLATVLFILPLGVLLVMWIKSEITDFIKQRKHKA